MKMSKDYFKRNAKKIGLRVFFAIKDENFTNNIIAYELGYEKSSIARKNNNSNGMYYNYDDLKKISKILNYRFEYLACLDDFKTDQDIIGLNKEDLHKNYLIAIKYLNSIGIYLKPGAFWYGTHEQFINAKKDIMPFLTQTAINNYRKNKAYYDKDTFLYLSLDRNPKEEMAKIEELQTKQLSTNNTFDYFINNEQSASIKDKISCGYICMRFYVSFSKEEKSDLKTISIESANKLFAYIDKSTKNIVKTLIDCELLR